MRALLLGLAACCFCLSSTTWLHAAQEVRVGGYDFPPYLFRPESEHPKGLVTELLDVLNGMQDGYRFVLVPTAATRRYRDLASGRFDLMLFESSRWGWQDTPHLSLPLAIEDAEVYVALAGAGRDQRYFDDFTGKRMALYRGYHYGFAGFDADPDYLGHTFNAQMTYSHDSNLRMVLMQRADVAVITRSYLQMYLEHNPEHADRLLVSQRFDQVYQHQVLLRPGGPLTPGRMAELLVGLQDDDDFARLLRRYHLALEKVKAGD